MTTYDERLVKMFALETTSWKDFDATEKQAINLLSWTIQKIGHDYELLVNREYWRENFGCIDTRLSADKRLISFCYTRDVQFHDHVWNAFELVCRGLVFETVSGRVVARPFSKFFNVDQDVKDRDPKTYILYCGRKEDGMLVIVYWYENMWHANTKKTFSNPEATFWLNHLPLSFMNQGCTYMFELVTENTRQVVNYTAEKNGMYLLAIRDNNYGDHLEQRLIDQLSGFLRPPNYDYIDLAEVREEVEKLNPHEQEGFVVYYQDGVIEKVKSKRYFELHKLLTRISIGTIQQVLFKELYQQFEEGDLSIVHLKKYLAGIPEFTLNDVFETVPPFFIPIVKDMVDKLIKETTAALSRIEYIFDFLPKDNRKFFAEKVIANHKEFAPYLFAMLDNREVGLFFLIKNEFKYETKVPMIQDEE